MFTFTHTCSAVRPSHFVKAAFDCLFEVEISPVNDFEQSISVEVSFHDREYTFDGVELGRVAHVVDRLDVQFFVKRFDIFRFVHV